MRATLTLGRIMGIEIKFHYSWFFIFLLLVASLAFGYMPHQYPGLSQETYLVIGIVAAGTLFTSVLLHELSHSYVAIRKGIRIPSIVLFFFGGVSQMANEPSNPSDEIKIAIAGPLSSFAIGGTFLLLWLAVQSTNLGVPLSAILQYGALINFLVGSFNMVPAFPLDGGRVLRASLWRRSNNMLKATLSAARISMIFATALIYGSLGVFILARDASGIWLFFIGLFLRSSANAALQQAVLKDRLRGVLAREVAALQVTLSPYTSLEEFSETLGATKQRRFPVVQDGILVGIFEPKDMKRVPRKEWRLTSVGRLKRGIEGYPVVAQDTPAVDIPTKMGEYEMSELFVVEDGRFVGTVSYPDLIRYVQASNEGRVKLS